VARTHKGKSKDRRCRRNTTKRKWKKTNMRKDKKVEKDRRMISRYRKGIMKWREKKQPRTD